MSTTHARSITRVVAWAVMAVLASCSDERIVDPGVAQVTGTSHGIGGTEPRRWSDHSDSSLWDAVVRSDTTLIVGIKAPSAAEGLVKGQPTASREQWLSAIRQFAADPDLRVRYADSTRLPVILLRPRSENSLKAIRRLPFIAFAEPAGGKFMLASSCSPGDPYAWAKLVVPYPPYAGGDTVSATYLAMNAINAMKLHDGSGQLVGLIDTGLDKTPNLEYDPAWWGTRSLLKATANGNYGVSEFQHEPACQHGTRIAGILAAPHNLRSAVGLAKGAGLISVRVADGVFVWNESIAWNIAVAMNYLSNKGAKTIVMAMGGLNDYSVIGWEIDDGYYNRGITYVTAAGTCASGNNCPWMGQPVYPASKGEVLAATGALHDGSRPQNAFDYGAKYEGVTAYTHLATTGVGLSHVVDIEGSSAGTAFVGGIATLVKARNPGMVPRDVINRIVRTSGDACGAPPAWKNMINASAAVGGPCVPRLHDDVWSMFQFGQTFTYRARVIHNFADGFAVGGSRNYRVDWSTTGGAVLEQSSTQSSTFDDYGNTVFQSGQSFRFLASHDGLPYNIQIKATVFDNVLGTVDTRVTRVIQVCPNFQNCYNAGRYFPGSTAPLSVSISGPNAIGIDGSYSWTASVSGTNSSGASLVWEASYDGGSSWSQIGTGTSVGMSFYQEGPYTLTLRVTATTASESASSTHSVYVDTFCGGNIC